MKNIRVGRVLGLALLLVLAIGTIGFAKGKATTISIMVPEHWQIAEAIEKGDWELPPYHRRWFSERVREFQEANPNIKLELETLGWDQIASNFVIRSMGKTAPDVAIFDVRHLQPLATGGYLQPLDAFDYDEWSDFIDETCKAVTIDEHIYMMPQYHAPVLFYYNKRMFKEAGLSEPPKTWAELIDYSEKLTRDIDGDGKIDQYGFGTQCSNVHKDAIFFFVPLVWSQGGVLEENGRAVFNTPEIRNALQLYVDMVRKYNVAPVSMANWGKEEAFDGFSSELVAMTTNLTAMHPVAEERLGAENIGVAAFPLASEEDNPFTYVELFGFVMSKDSANKDAAWEFIKHMGANETLYAAAHYYGTAPSRKSAVGHPVYKSSPFLEFAAEYSVEAGHPMPYIEELTYWWDLLSVAMQEAVLGVKTVEQALTDAQTAYDAKLR